MKLKLCERCRIVLLQVAIKAVGLLFLIFALVLGSLLAIYIYFYIQLFFYLPELRFSKLPIMLFSLATVEAARRVGDHLLFEFQAKQWQN